MNKSDSIKELAAALAKAQAEMPTAPMDSVGTFQHKYASLGSVINTVKPVLERHGLSVCQLPTSENGWVGLSTMLLHDSGEWLEETITLPLTAEPGRNSAQETGAIITYLRRYSLSAVLGLYSDEDTDGEAGRQTQSEKAWPDGEPRKPPPKKDWPMRPWNAETLKRAMEAKVAAYKGKSVEPSEKQLDFVRSSLGKLNLSDAERHTVTLGLFNVESTGDLTAAQCSALIDWIDAKAENDWTPSQDARVEAQAVIKQYQKKAGQTEF